MEDIKRAHDTRDHCKDKTSTQEYLRQDLYKRMAQSTGLTTRRGVVSAMVTILDTDGDVTYIRIASAGRSPPSGDSHCNARNTSPILFGDDFECDESLAPSLDDYCDDDKKTKPQPPHVHVWTSTADPDEFSDTLHPHACTSFVQLEDADVETRSLMLSIIVDTVVELPGTPIAVFVWYGASHTASVPGTTNDNRFFLYEEHTRLDMADEGYTVDQLCHTLYDDTVEVENRKEIDRGEDLVSYWDAVHLFEWTQRLARASADVSDATHRLMIAAGMRKSPTKLK